MLSTRGAAEDPPPANKAQRAAMLSPPPHEGPRSTPHPTARHHCRREEPFGAGHSPPKFRTL